MFLGKVGQKSIAFINHKPFHPGNLKNLERVWQAEEEEAARLKAQKEAIERRRHEAQIEELRVALRAKERAENGALFTTQFPPGPYAGFAGPSPDALAASSAPEAPHTESRKSRKRGRRKGAASASASNDQLPNLKRIATAAPAAPIPQSPHTEDEDVARVTAEHGEENAAEGTAAEQPNEDNSQCSSVKEGAQTITVLDDGVLF